MKAPTVKEVTAAALPVAAASSLPVSVVRDHVVDDASKSPQEGKNAPRYDSMIFEAVTGMKDPKGSDIGAIVHFIEQRHEVPQNFRRLLSSKLRRLVMQGKLEKVDSQSGY